MSKVEVRCPQCGDPTTEEDLDRRTECGQCRFERALEEVFGYEGREGDLSFQVSPKIVKMLAGYGITPKRVRLAQGDPIAVLPVHVEKGPWVSR